MIYPSNKGSLTEENQYITLIKQRKKTTRALQSMRKGSDKSGPFHDENIQQTRNSREPQHDERRL